MGYAVYSPEDFPKSSADGLVDYKQALGVQVVLKAHQWTELDEMGYKQTYHLSSERGDTKEIFVSSKEVAERLCRNAGRPFGNIFYPVGLLWANTDKATKAEIEAIEHKSEEQNKAFRKKVIEEFDLQFRVKMQGGAGRYTPTAYEMECYELLNMKPPDVVNRPTDSAPAQPVQVIIPNLEELVEAMVAKRMEAATAPVKR